MGAAGPPCHMQALLCTDTCGPGPSDASEGPPSTNTHGEFWLHMPRGHEGYGGRGQQGRPHPPHLLTHGVRSLAQRGSAEGSEPVALREGQQEGSQAWGKWKGWSICSVGMSYTRSPQEELVLPQCGDYFGDDSWEVSWLPS